MSKKIEKGESGPLFEPGDNSNEMEVPANNQCRIHRNLGKGLDGWARRLRKVITSKANLEAREEASWRAIALPERAEPTTFLDCLSIRTHAPPSAQVSGRPVKPSQG